ncbi:MAG: hypothetical protein J6B91_09515 [Prevotella sp.]|nr:hypothetical protein [Prevotella sp.]
MKSKSIFRVMALCVVTTAMFCACGSSQKTVTPGGTTKGTQQSSWGTKKEESDSQKEAEKSPATRSWGEAVNHRLSFAKSYAEGQARAALARAISGIIKTATQESDLQWNKYAGSETEGSSVTDEGSKADGLYLQIAEEIVSNTVVIKTDTYMQPNRQYHVFVCVEYQGDMSNMTNNIVKKVKQKVPDEDRLKMEYQFNKFEEKIKEELEKKNKER